MKKKQKTYLLLILVLSIWGILGFRIVKTINPPETEATVASPLRDFRPTPIKKRDTFSIVANYRDPFLGTLPATTVPKKPLSAKIEKPSIPEKQISYSGWVSDKASGQKIFFLKVEGQQLMLTLTQEQQGVKLLSGDAKKIKVRCNGRIKSINRSQ